MFGSEMLEVALGLIVVFSLLSVICSASREAMEGFFKTRAAYLVRGVEELLNDKTGKGLVKALYTHPAVYALYKGEYTASADRHEVSKWVWRTNLPTYIPASSFAVAMLDIAARGTTPGDKAQAGATSPRVSIDNIRSSIDKLGNPEVQRAVLAAIDMADGSLARAQLHIEQWYNGAMDRVSGWYKRRTQLYLFIVGLIVSIWLNVNTITIARYLYQDDAARAALVASAEGLARDTASIQKASLDTLFGRVSRLQLPIGWRYGLGGMRTGDATPNARAESTNVWDKAGDATQSPLALAILGWLMTALAISLGAPFWFDMLNKFMVIRSTVKPHEKSEEESSEDRQAKKNGIVVLSQSPTGTSAATTSSAQPGAASPPSLAALEADLPDQPSIAVRP